MLSGLLLGLILAELVARLLVPEFMSLHVHPGSIIHDQFMAHDRLGQYDERLGWKLRPSAVGVNRGREFTHEIRTNSHGYRDTEHTPARPPGKRRIVLLGDSFAMGWGVERQQMFSSLLERLVPDLEVINLGVAGYGTDQEVLTYESEGSRYETDWVLLAVLPGNDVHDNLRGSRYHKPYFLLDGDSLSLHGVPVPYTVVHSRKVPVSADAGYQLHDWLDSHSALYAFTFHQLASLEPLQRRWLASGLLHRQITVFGREDVLFLKKEPPANFARGWLILERLLRRWRDDVRQHQAVPVVLLVPNHLQVYPELWQEAVKEYHLDAQEYDLEAPHKRLVRACQEDGIAVLDLLPGLRDAAAGSLPIYWRQDPHWTPEGHRVVAELIAEFLARQPGTGTE
jgi:lysophospholipase L1-like esterase